MFFYALTPMTLNQLWKERSRPTIFSKTWYRSWGKRVITLGFLIRALKYLSFLRRNGAKLGEMTIISPSVFQGSLHRLKIGSHCAIGRVHIALHAEVSIGNNVVINDSVTMLTGTHDIQDASWGLLRKPILIGEYAWVAQGAIIMPGVSIGEGAVVGAGSVVTKDVPAYEIVAGNPARSTGKTRTRQLTYDPVAKLAVISAWLN